VRGQVALRWIIQHGHTLVTASGTSAYDSEDLELFDWALTPGEMATLDAIV
jgi:diketogulonate reductase-like aldo/keto reductase